MSKKLLHQTCVVVILSLALVSTLHAELVAHWRLDDGSGTVAVDSSGNGHDGTLLLDPQWVVGKYGYALEFGGISGQRVEMEGYEGVLGTQNRTVMAWVKTEGFGDWISWGQNTNTQKWIGRINDNAGNGAVGALRTECSGGYIISTTVVNDGEWHHLTSVLESAGAPTTDDIKMYVDGVQEVISGSRTVAIDTVGNGRNVWIADGHHDRPLPAVIDDVRIYDHAMTVTEILGTMAGIKGWPYALGPDPKVGDMISATWLNMSWSPGQFAVSHDVYIGDNFDDVNNATHDSATFVGNQGETTLIVGFPGYTFPEGLVPGTTYYWRIDEVNDTDPNSPWKGDVWSFWIPPRTAYNRFPADGTKNVLQDVVLNWTAGFGAILHQVYFGDNFDEVNNASGAALAPDTTFVPGTLEADKTYYWRVDEFAAPITHRGQVFSFTTVPDVAVTNPNLMLWWTLDEGEGTTAIDWSGHGNHGAIMGDAQWTDGYQGTALTFGEDVYVEAAGYEGITGTAPRTCCAWIRTTTATNQNIMSWGQNVAGQKWRVRVNGTGGLRTEVNGGYHYGLTNIADGLWHHVAVTFEDDGSPDALDTLLYVDGQLDATLASLDEPIDTAAGPVRIGESPWHDAPFMNEIDDARIYDKVLTAEEIQQAMLGDTSLAGNPVPERNTLVDIRDITSLSWSRGDTTASHDVYFGTDRDAVAGADNGAPQFQDNQAGTSLSLAGLVEFGGGDYYWRVDEVQADGTVIAGTIWKFTVPDYLIVDNFESYDNVDPAPGEPGVNRIFDKWIDGFGTLTNGALVGNDLPPYAETGTVHGGAQSMIYRYDNTGKNSEATLTLTKRDWTAEGVTKLSLWLAGDSANAADRVYVALNGTAVVYHDDPAATQLTGWREWVIDLATFGVDLSNVNSIAIGIGTKNVPAAGGTGTLYFDDIRLYR